MGDQVLFPTREPDASTSLGRAWKIRATRPGSIGGWFVNVNWAHPVWNLWLVGVVHLRDIEGVPPPKRHYPDAAYEFGIWSVDPRPLATVPFDPDMGEGHGILHPPDAIVHFHGVDDRRALMLLDSAVNVILAGRMSPDSGFRRAWEELVRGTARCLANGRHDPS